MFKTLVKSKYFIFDLVIFRKKNRKEIYKFTKLLNKNSRIFVNSFVEKSKKISKYFLKKKIDLAISLAWHNKLKKNFLNHFSLGVINFHPSPLPLNRGCHSAFWGIYNNTNHGSTMHFMDKNWDWGAIIDKLTFPNRDDYFAEYIFKKSRTCSLMLLQKNLKKMRDGNFKNLKKFTKKDLKRSNYNKKNDIKKVTNLNINQTIKVSKLWRLIKATKFGNNGYYINSGKNRYLIRNIIQKQKK
tara:strand:- start:60 stop:785 length:726 start_codon:yes stop_codon:yes gene_type:complete